MTVTDHEPAISVPLSTLLRAGSAEEHRAAEESSFIRELLAGGVSELGYATYLSRLRRIYDAIETLEGKLGQDAPSRAVIDPALHRVASIDADLEFWGGPVEAASPATDAYVARIRAAESWGGLFLAHHYTRYLGDLSGGQVIGRLLSREFDLPATGEGVAFYRFEAIAKPKPYKDAYRARVDAVPIGEPEREQMLAEVKAAFALNRAVFDELALELPRWRREARA